MKKAITVLWMIFITAILVFVITVFLAKSDAFIWRILSVTMPVAGIAFVIAIILTIVYSGNSKRND